ncbi:MAG: formate dehydrogenase accessory sulfurtransferase FdhD [Austwickia sp.]|nr:formate dehydrogenase accessory sulfurtransferase FdhD [Austwickia sp.]
MGRLTTRRRVRRAVTDAAAGATWTDAVDVVAVEEPLEVRIGGVSLTVTMRTPGHDFELVHGLLYAEGVIAAAADVARMRYCPGAVPDLTAGGKPSTSANSYNVLDLDLSEGVRLSRRARALLTSSACGVCGTPAIADLVAAELPDLHDDPVTLSAASVAALPERLRASQKVFGLTGGVHAAAWCTPRGHPELVREDVGRHNAVDKVIGWALLQGHLPGRGRVLAVSGRASYELVQKAIRAGIPVLVAVSAPSSLAVDLAEAAGLTLVAFTRQGRFTAYTHVHRIVD